MLSLKVYMYLINGKEIRFYADRKIFFYSSLFSSEKMGHFKVDIDLNRLPRIKHDIFLRRYNITCHMYHPCMECLGLG